MKKDLERPYYGYGVTKYITGALAGGGIAGVALAILFTVLTYPTWALIMCWVWGAILLVSGVFWHFSTGFVNDPVKTELLRDNFMDLLRTVWDGKGRVLDIGTGRGRSAVEIAKRFPDARVTGVDVWSKLWAFWGQTRQGAERNAAAAKVSDRCAFQYGNALNLPFEGGEFQLVVSTFAFHEVRVSDRTALLKEAVRVLAPGGTLLVLDLFPRGYKVKNVAELVKKVEQSGLKDVKHRPLKEAGISLGRLAGIWRIAYLSGTKV